MLILRNLVQRRAASGQSGRAACSSCALWLDYAAFFRISALDAAPVEGKHPRRIRSRSPENDFSSGALGTAGLLDIVAVSPQTEACGRAVAFILVPGNGVEIPAAPASLDKMPPTVRLLTDKGYDAGSLRTCLAASATEAVVPSTRSRKTHSV